MIIFQNIRRYLNDEQLWTILFGALVGAVLLFSFVNFGREAADKKSLSRRSDQENLAEMASASKRLTSVDFEVFGVVQGVFFRKYTQQEATRLGLVGWVQNTHGGTVVGVVQGPENQVAQMKVWLTNTGSPKSKIERCNTKNERDIAHLEFNHFDIVREKGDTKPRKKKTVTKTKVKK